MNEILRNHTNISNAFLNHSTNDTLPRFEESLPKKVAKTTAYCLLFLVSLTGNVLIIWAIYRDKRLRTSTNILVTNMAVSDLLYSQVIVNYKVVEIIFDGRWLIDGDFGLALCKLVPFLGDVCFCVSVYSCIFIAIDRYYAVAHPLKGGFSISRLKYIIPGIWIGAVLIHSPHLYAFSLKKYGDWIYCNMAWSQAGVPHMFVAEIYFIILFSLISGVPNVFITFLYLLIVYKLRKHKVPGQSLDSVRIRREQQNKKVLKMSVAIVSLLILSKLMFDILNFLSLYVNLKNLSNRKDLNFAAIFLVRLSCCFNFFVYLVFNDIYRNNFKTMIFKCLCICPCNKPQVNVPNKRCRQTVRIAPRGPLEVKATQPEVELLDMKILQIERE